MPRVSAVLLAVAIVSHASAQAPLAFESASLKRNAAGVGPRLIRTPPGGTLTAVNEPLSDLILFAYGVPGLEFRAVGIPSWAFTTNYDVTAHMDAGRVAADGTFSIADMRAMMRTLLQTRFKLVSRMEQRDAPLYALVKSRSDKTLGARLRASGVECPPIVLPAGMPPPPPPPPPPGTPRDAAPKFDFNC